MATVAPFDASEEKDGAASQSVEETGMTPPPPAKARPSVMVIKEKRWWLIDPRSARGSRFIGRLDLATSLALVFTALVTPFEVAYLPAPISAADPLFIVNRIVDAVFLFDMFVAFILMTEIQEEKNGSFRTIWLDTPSSIALHYMRTWFAIDLISILVSGVDIVSVMGGGPSPRSRSCAPFARRG